MTVYDWQARARAQQRRFWSKVKIDQSSGCWLWIAAKDRDGFGRFQITGRGGRFRGDHPIQKNVMAHRLAWELEKGYISPKTFLQHICKNRGCCNPAHLKIK